MGFRPKTRLASATGRDFEQVALPYFQFVFPAIARPTPLAAWDKKGVDLMTSPENSPIEVCVQCKSTTKPQFDLDDIREFKKEVEAFIASDVRCSRYILALNRSDIDGAIQKAVNEFATSHPNFTKIEVWPLNKIVDEAQAAVVQIIRDRVKQFNKEWREQLIGRFAPSGSWVRRVPANIFRMMLSWDDEPEIRGPIRSGDNDIQALLLDERRPHISVLIGDDGIGKTSAALIASQVQTRTVIYVPASSLDKSASRGTSVLTREIAHAIDVQPPHDNTDQLFEFFLGRGLTHILRQDSSVVLIVDGLDENRAFRGFHGLKLIRSQLKGMRCKTVISTRTKHFNLRTGDFSEALKNKGKEAERRKGVEVIELQPWTENTVIEHIEDVAKKLPPQERKELQTLVSAIKNKKAEELYGSLLSHPIFLDLIIDDVIHDHIRKVTRASLVRSWILRKIKRDQSKYDSRPLRGDLTQEARLIFRALEDVAIEMSEADSYVPIERISHTDATRIFSQYHLTEDETFDLLLKSVLVAVGQTTTFRDANVKFSHRVFHEYMIASALLRQGIRPKPDTPPEIANFFDDLRKEEAPQT